MLVLNLPFKALMFLTLMRPSLVLFLVLWLKLVKDFLKVRCRLALLPFLISCLIWLDLVASLPLIKERILVIILLLHFLSLMLGSVLVLMLPLLVWLTPDLRIKKSLLKCNWTIRKRLPRCKMILPKRLLAFSRRDRKSGSAGMPRPISYAVFCLKKKKALMIKLLLGFSPTLLIVELFVIVARPAAGGWTMGALVCFDTSPTQSVATDTIRVTYTDI